MNARQVLLRELASIIGLLPNYRTSATVAGVAFDQNKTQDNFRRLLETQIALEIIEAKLDFINLVLDEADE